MDVFKNMLLFVEVAKARSFRKAGELLDMPISTVSRRIAELEKYVGLPLFNRTTRQVVLTDAGLGYFESCQRIVEDMRAVHEQFDEKQLTPSGLIRLSVPVDFSLMALSPVLPEFSERYPAIRFDLDLTLRQVDVIAERYDVTIRRGQTTEPNIVSRLIAEASSGLYASTEYVRRRGMPAQPRDLLEHKCLIMHAHPWTLFPVAGGGPETIKMSSLVLANNAGMLRRLALNHMGIALLGEAQVSRDIAEGTMVRVLPEWMPGTLSFYALTASRKVPARVRVFIDFLVERFQGQRVLAKPRP